MFGLFRPSPRAVWAKALAEYAEAYRLYQAELARPRQCTQALHHASNRLRLACRAKIVAERAINPLPPMPRRGITA